ncbi:uncharacterized protein LOC143357000 [Halictus rubicundus]|uniref:uncharacterized protein LOC143357000 n=1 Tax=Halictus rubicundus TaxID=77578 RepID=UPI0040365B0E
MPRNLSETDRKKNQFDKEERVHLLSLMKQYAPLLDKSTSTLARRKIWTTIENEFKKMGFTRKTSAQLKKYWQNYKYHCKKARALGKESKKCANSSDSESPEWNRYRVLVENRPASKFSEIQEASQPTADRSPASPIESTETQEDPGSSEDVIGIFTIIFRTAAVSGSCDLSCVKTEKEEEDATFTDHVSPESDETDEKKEIPGLDRPPLTDCKTRNRIVVSSAKISDNSVTVSVLYPDENERPAKSEFYPSTTDVLWQPRERRRTCEDSSDSQNASNEDRESSEHRIRLDEFERRNPPTTSASVESGEGSAAAVVVSTKQDVERNDSLGSKRGYVFLTDYRNKLKHRLLLQQLETEEKRLKVKIAEMGVQEVQLRIQAVREDMRRAEELYRLNLARAAAGNVNF